MTIYRSDSEALAAHDNYIMGLHEEDDDYEIIGECSACNKDIWENESMYEVRRITLCEECYENIKER